MVHSLGRLWRPFIANDKKVLRWYLYVLLVRGLAAGGGLTMGNVDPLNGQAVVNDLTSALNQHRTIIRAQEPSSLMQVVEICVLLLYHQGREAEGLALAWICWRHCSLAGSRH
jgi:hypothetical protein